MRKFQNHIKKAFFCLICIQLMCMNMPMVSILNHIQETAGLTQQSNSQKSQPGEKSSNQDLPGTEDESKEDSETFVIKIFTPFHNEFVFAGILNTEFVLYNTRHKIQFHPEFSTPPPKNLLA